MLAFGDQTTGSAGALKEHTDGLAGSLLAGATATAASMTILNFAHSAARFEMTAPFGKPDRDGRRKLIIGRPSSGLLDRLPPDCRLDDAERDTPVLLDAPSASIRDRAPASARRGHRDTTGRPHRGERRRVVRADSVTKPTAG